jgi:hypothetical protein
MTMTTISAPAGAEPAQHDLPRGPVRRAGEPQAAKSAAWAAAHCLNVRATDPVTSCTVPVTGSGRSTREAAHRDVRDVPFMDQGPARAPRTASAPCPRCGSGRPTAKYWSRTRLVIKQSGDEQRRRIA